MQISFHSQEAKFSYYHGRDKLLFFIWNGTYMTSDSNFLSSFSFCGYIRSSSFLRINSSNSERRIFVLLSITIFLDIFLEFLSSPVAAVPCVCAYICDYSERPCAPVRSEKESCENSCSSSFSSSLTCLSKACIILAIPLCCAFCRREASYYCCYYYYYYYYCYCWYGGCCCKSD